MRRTMLFCRKSEHKQILERIGGKLLFLGLAAKFMPKGGKEDGAKGAGIGLELNSDMLQMLGGFTVLRLTGMMSMANIHLTKEQLLDLNAQLNKIKAPKK